MQLYLCRHGETEWTVSGQHTGKTDIALTAHGKEQAMALRVRLQKIKFEKVLSSPRKRALQTCEGMGAEIEPLAAEWDYGDYEGLTSSEIHEKNPHWNLFKEGAPRGESPDQIGQRADQLLKKLSSYSGRVALFSHGHFLRVLTARFLGLPPEEAKIFVLSVASISILGFQQKQPVLILWNSTAAKPEEALKHGKE